MKSIQDKYYFQTPTKDNYRKGNYLIRHNANLELTLDEDIEMPNFDLYIDKLEEGKSTRPKSTKYDKYKEIMKEVFNDYFQLALKAMKNCKWEEAEYYLDQKSPTWTDLVMYTSSQKNAFRLQIDIRDFVDSFALSFGLYRGYAYRAGYRKNATPIAEEIFIATVKETIKFFEDQNSYHINLDEYLKSIKKIVSGNIPELESEKSINLNGLINQLEIKKADITNRLIESDSDSETTRASLRGEKAGIEYSLRVIKKYFRMSSH